MVTYSFSLNMEKELVFKKRLEILLRTLNEAEDEENLFNIVDEFETLCSALENDIENPRNLYKRLRTNDYATNQEDEFDIIKFKKEHLPKLEKKLG